MTDDDLLAVLHGAVRVATSAVRTGGGLYGWSFWPQAVGGRACRRRHGSLVRAGRGPFTRLPVRLPGTD
ncbi:hypothetical protein OHT52_14660 [Streptomyces sp. NBC_00247]|uniref:hypothetical protein n=1 Tax=Streptomyces sp. NBC_00247 TaxID=2975689 RepID=UPI002E2C6E0E|nr:hypothetical protein [Streptomyces sp. NBC_00247]